MTAPRNRQRCVHCGRHSIAHHVLTSLCRPGDDVPYPAYPVGGTAASRMDAYRDALAAYWRKAPGTHYLSSAVYVGGGA